MALSDQDLEKALRLAHEAGDTENATILAKEWKSRLSPAKEKPKEEVGGGMAFVNKAIARGLGAPVDIVSAGLNKIGLPTSETPFLGSESIRRGMERIGAPTPDREAETLTENIGEVFGEVASFALPAAGASRLLSGAKGLTGGVASAMNRELVERPIQSLAIESGGATGAGIARDISKEQDISPTGQLVAETVGGLGGGFLASAPVVRQAVGLSKRTFAPFTEAGSFDRASARAREVVENPELAAQNIKDMEGANLMPSAKSQDPGLTLLENTVAMDDPALATQMSRKTSETVEALVNSIRESGNVKNAKDFVAKKRDRLNKALDSRVEIAGERAAREIAELGDVADESTISQIQFDQLQSALSDAKAQEEIVWRAVPQDAKVPTSKLKKVYSKWKRELSRSQSDSMPPIANKYIGGDTKEQMVPSGVIGIDGEPIMVPDVLSQRGKFKDLETIREVDGMYKRLGEDAQKARKESDNTKAKIAEDLREAILEDMESAKGNSQAKEALDTARKFSRKLNEKFSNGSVGLILGRKKGASGFNPELTLQKGVGQSGVPGSLAARDIADALETNVESLSAVQDFIKRKFLNTAVDDGIVNPSKAQTFLRNNRALLDNYPILRAQLEGARTAEDASRRVKKSSDSLRRKLDQASVSSTARFLKAPVDQEVKKIFDSGDPDSAMRSIVNLVKKDKSGNAMKGLRAGVSEYIIDNITLTGLDDFNRRKVSGSRLKGVLENENSRSALSRVFDNKAMLNWDKVAKELVVAERQMSSGGRSLPYVINDNSSYLLRIISRAAGARLGSKLARGAGSGASIQAAGQGADVVDRVMRKLTADKAKQMLIDATTTDDKLLIKLLERNPKVRDKKRDKVFRYYFLNNGRRLAEEDEDG